EAPVVLLVEHPDSFRRTFADALKFGAKHPHRARLLVARVAKSVLEQSHIVADLPEPVLARARDLVDEAEELLVVPVQKSLQQRLLRRKVMVDARLANSDGLADVLVAHCIRSDGLDERLCGIENSCFRVRHLNHPTRW